MSRDFAFRASDRVLMRSSSAIALARAYSGVLKGGRWEVGESGQPPSTSRRFPGGGCASVANSAKINIMSELHSSGQVLSSPYQDAWPREFARLSVRLAAALGPLAERVDHIGSTSIPGMPAKDIIDVQVIVSSLEPPEPIVAAIERIGFMRRTAHWNQQDHIPSGWHGDASEWGKMVFSPPETERPSNVHVRASGRANERYALLFRNYLRANDRARDAWAAFKQELARRFVNDLEAYGQTKDPATDVLVLAAELWARALSGRGAAF